MISLILVIVNQIEYGIHPLILTCRLACVARTRGTAGGGACTYYARMLTCMYNVCIMCLDMEVLVMRINMHIPDDLLAEIDRQAQQMHVNRTAWVIMVISHHIQSNAIVSHLPELLKRMDDLEEFRGEVERIKDRFIEIDKASM